MEAITFGLNPTQRKENNIKGKDNTNAIRLSSNKTQSVLDS